MFKSNYDKHPVVHAASFVDECWQGWEAIADQINAAVGDRRKPEQSFIVAVECYTGLHERELIRHLQEGLRHDHFFTSESVFRAPREIEALVEPYLGGDDPIFGFFCPQSLDAFLDPQKQSRMQQEISRRSGVAIVFGPGALLCCTPDLVVYADMPRWEGQLRQRRGEVSNLGTHNRGLKGSLQYKRAYFIDWRVCDRLKRASMARWDYLLDTTTADDPKMISGQALRAALQQTTRQPFRVLPFFDPAPWGGQWLKEVCDLERDAPNFGWGFDCVPEENSLLLQFGKTTVEVPSLNLVFQEPQALLGDAVYGLFGPEFPIRFDFLDTIGGGNLSLQVHPLVAYAQEKFGLHYTQDESYYILESKKDATVYLGVKPDTDIDALFGALTDAQTSGRGFVADPYVNQWPAKKHDHFLIPAGTVHCSGSDTVVLEISATPYIFTFKLWDWGRLGLDGLPRPINLTHGRRVLQTDRDKEWVEENLINALVQIDNGNGWREEKTGLHPLEFIETRRHWFTDTVPHDTHGTVNVLNLVQGDEALVESPTGDFAPFIVHYAETFVVPAAVGKYTIRPHGTAVGSECATMKAFVRSGCPEG
jgi:mannose-6-phosphate isomerase class I